MARPVIVPTGVERFFGEDEIIVSKTDPRGVIVYANKIFLDIAGFSEKEVIGQPHNMVRHPATPSSIFKLMWDRIQAGHEVFAYVCNMAKNGDHYWVLAHITPSFGADGTILGYHSNRRVPDARSFPEIKDLYTRLLAEEESAGSPKTRISAGLSFIDRMLDQRGVSYDRFIHSL
ncbi:PAS sensor domain-containing protein [Rhodospirillum rubrum]|uniref:PAS domain-containing protein n=1 Tax=Rhodospirillum rubrum TaxID=1085 RepID=UPI001905CD38|nr:PAS domain-containing protein [Rhodospirillum rubrum]MBK1666185.1 PAS sensor domain-containing protein [Rhodospirillum rubrum]MBK1677031.1 PAS sensor domain-containing protein [Rhodospirillum rubrum]